MMNSRIQELEQRPKIADWAGKVQDLCERAWEEATQNGLRAYDIQRFVAFLNDQDVFLLARLVIPDLRTLGEEPQQDLSSAQRDILHGTRQARESMASLQNLRQADYDTVLYQAEKKAFYDADLHRTRLFLRQIEAFTPDEEEAVKRWLDECPVKGKGKEKTEPKE